MPVLIGLCERSFMKTSLVFSDCLIEMRRMRVVCGLPAAQLLYFHIRFQFYCCNMKNYSAL